MEPTDRPTNQERRDNLARANECPGFEPRTAWDERGNFDPTRCRHCGERHGDIADPDLCPHGILWNADCPECECDEL